MSAKVRLCSSNMSPIVPGAFDIVTDPTKALRFKIISRLYVKSLMAGIIPEKADNKNCREILCETSREDKYEE